jgi:hypothetical protein
MIDYSACFRSKTYPQITQIMNLELCTLCFVLSTLCFVLRALYLVLCALLVRTEL